MVNLNLQELEAQAAQLAAQIASAKAVAQAAEDNELVIIPLEGADGEMHLHKVTAGAARILLKNSAIAKAVAQPEGQVANNATQPGKKGWLKRHLVPRKVVK